MAVTGAFYSDLASKAPGVDTSSTQIRTELAPLNKPDPAAGPVLVLAANESSTDSFHLAMGLAAALLLAGALVNAVGIRDPEAAALAESAGRGQAAVPDIPD